MSTRHAGAAPSFIHAFTGVRAVGALAVMVWHLREVAYVLMPSTTAASPLIDIGVLGLDAFFVLSGFVIAHNYADRLAVLDRRKLLAYLGARFARVYPVHLFALLGTALLVAYVARLGGTLSTATSFTAVSFVGNVFMMQGLPGVDAWNVPSWSVSCEFAAYLVFPLVAARLVRLRWPVAVLLAGVLVGAQTAALFALRDTAFIIPALHWLQITGEFGAGALLWLAWRHRGRSGPWWDVVAIGAVGGIVAIVAWWGQPFFAAIPLVPVLIVAVAGSTGPVHAFLTARPVTWVGERSYSIYLTHSPVIMVAVLFVVPPAEYLDAPTWQKVTLVAGCAVASLVVGAVVHAAVEEPSRRWLRSRTPAWPETEAPQARPAAAPTTAATR